MEKACRSILPRPKAGSTGSAQRTCRAQATLGLLLFQSGIALSAMRWLKLAANAGEPRALLIVGTAMYNGDGVAADPVTAYAYVSRAAAQGLAPAQATLADMDDIMPLEQRQKGVELAQKMASEPKASAPAPAVTKAPPVKTAPTGAQASRGEAIFRPARLPRQ